MELGQLYRSKAVIGATPSLPPALRPEDWAGQPGTRAPYALLKDGRSTLDLFQEGWVVVATDQTWGQAAATAGERLGIEVQFHRVDPEVLPLFGVGRSGASVIRPDGYVGCRADDLPLDASSLLTQAVAQMSSSRVRSAPGTRRA